MGASRTLSQMAISNLNHVKTHIQTLALGSGGDEVSVKKQKQSSHGAGVTGSEIITSPVRSTRVVYPTQTFEAV